MKVLKHFKQFSTKNYTQRLDIVQNLYKFWAQNVSILQEINCFNTPRPKYVPGSKMFQYLHIVYYYKCRLKILILLDSIDCTVLFTDQIFIYSL